MIPRIQYCVNLDGRVILQVMPRGIYFNFTYTCARVRAIRINVQRMVLRFVVYVSLATSMFKHSIGTCYPQIDSINNVNWSHVD